MAQVHDDLGKPIAYQGGIAPPAALKDVHRIVFRPRWMRIIVGLWLFGMMGGIVLAAWSTISGSMQPLMWWWALVLLPAIIALSIGIGLRGKSAMKELRDRFRYCSACHYDLRGIPSGEDGLTTCPECSAAWRMPTSTDAIRPT
jgi:hypothetical protein